MGKLMRYGFFATAIVLILSAPIAALDTKDVERDDRGLRIELEVVPTPEQKDFEQYVQELVASAQRDAREGNPKYEEGIAKKKQPKPLNPLVLFRW
jgi:hypothetical protein